MPRARWRRLGCDARPGAPGLRSAGVGAHRLSAGGDQGQCAAGRGQALHGVRAFGAGPGDPGQARVRQALRHGSRLERTGVVAEGGRLGHRDQSGAGRGAGRVAGATALSGP
ncbi:hypothetical protein G6F40_015540 [Rhizopus arrhizus]|nr:hypothetical protein G6F31_017278 [Rhizopus arrhizus]KAG1081316.1 hypothetical protein G6F40_015540 [Rhizopus arrhizus]